jgi:hypothetical protein
VALTPLGFPLFDLTDDANIANKLNAISNALDTYLTPARQNMIQLAGKAVPDSTLTTITGWTDAESSRGMGSYTAGIRTISLGGFYQINSQISYLPGATAAGLRMSRLHVNGSVVAYGVATPTSTQDVSISVEWAGTLHAGDTVQIVAYQTQGSTLNIQTSQGASTWQMVRVGPL